jgi:hypothetical protein
MGCICFTKNPARPETGARSIRPASIIPPANPTAHAVATMATKPEIPPKIPWEGFTSGSS